MFKEMFKENVKEMFKENVKEMFKENVKEMFKENVKEISSINTLGEYQGNVNILQILPGISSRIYIRMCLPPEAEP